MILSGPIAYVDRMTYDRRIVTGITLSRRWPLPLVDPGEPRRFVGRIIAVQFRADGEVWAKADVWDDMLALTGLDPEVGLPVGVDLADVEIEPQGPVEVTRMSGTLIAVTITPISVLMAWPSTILKAEA